MKAKDVKKEIKLINKAIKSLKKEKEKIEEQCEHNIKYHYRITAEDDCYYYCTVCNMTFDNNPIIS